MSAEDFTPRTGLVDTELLVDPAAELEELHDALMPLEVLNINVKAFTRANIFALRMTVPQYIKEVRVLQNLQDVQLIRKVWTEAISHKCATLPDEADAGVCLSFARWLKRGVGAKVLSDAQHLIKLQKRAVGSVEPKVLAFVQLLDQQIADMHAERKKIQAEGQAKIDELRREIQRVEREYDEKAKASSKRFKPARKYVPPTKAKIDEECWNAYLNKVQKSGKTAPEWNAVLQEQANTMYQQLYLTQHKQDFCGLESNQIPLKVWADSKLKELADNHEFVASARPSESWVSRVESHLHRLPLPQRVFQANNVPVGPVSQLVMNQSRNMALRTLLNPQLLTWKSQIGMRKKPPLQKANESRSSKIDLLLRNPRILVLRKPERGPLGGIPTARSKFEAMVRKVIGGGEMLNWSIDSNMYRGGGNFTDALTLLADARYDAPEMFLSDYLSIEKARSLLCLPSDLKVPCHRNCVSVNNFNNEATAGPFFRAHGIRNKYGMRLQLEDFAWECYNAYVDSGGNPSMLPYISSRVGFRTKLVSTTEAFAKMKDNKPIGRCVMMLDAIEQMFSTPLYNVLSKTTAAQRFDIKSGFRNTIVRASSDWAKFWEEVKAAKVIVELDWKKFDRERPTEDLEFIIQVIISCFKPTDERERLFLRGYGIMLRRCLIDRYFITDDGGVFKIDGMVPSGSLWTGWVDTALNILYLQSVMISLGFVSTAVSPKCAGDDNLTLFWKDFDDKRLLSIKTRLNAWFRAGIDDEDFFIHRPPYHVTREQATFPPGTDLTKGTSRKLKDAIWIPIDGEPIIDQAQGLSHRWQYVFRGKPKFLSAYWLEDGRPIRPTHVNAEKLLFPEGIHKDIEQYESAVLSMIVDNPYNHHNVNHCMHRFIICEQVKRQSAAGIDPVDILWFSRIRPGNPDVVPYPMVASWRRCEGYVDLEQLPFISDYVKDLKEFVAGVTSLYARDSIGGLDAWRFTEIIRGETDLGTGQFGNDIDVWIHWLHHHPLTRYLKPIKRHRQPPLSVMPDKELHGRIEEALQVYRDIRGTTTNASAEAFSLFLSNVIKHQG
nr:TPA_asm: RNA-dependent RNA polymerase [Allium cepa amalgavirus 1]